MRVLSLDVFIDSFYYHTGLSLAALKETSPSPLLDEDLNFSQPNTFSMSTYPAFFPTKWLSEVS